MSSVGDPLFKNEVHEFLGRRGHIFKALPERDDGKAHALEVLYHLDSSPAVKRDLPDIEALTEVFDELLDEAVVDDVAVRREEIALLLPQVIRDVVSPHTDIQRILRHPEVWEHGKLIVLVLRREDQHEGRDVRSGGEVRLIKVGKGLHYIDEDRMVVEKATGESHPEASWLVDVKKA